MKDIKKQTPLLSKYTKYLNLMVLSVQIQAYNDIVVFFLIWLFQDII